MNLKINIQIKLIFTVLLVCQIHHFYSNHISGTIKDNFGEPLPFASVYIKNSTYGISSNAFGEYFLELKSGEYTVVYSFIGYESVEKKIILYDSPQEINVILHEDTQNLIELEVVSNTKNKALEIIKKAKEARKTIKTLGTHVSNMQKFN